MLLRLVPAVLFVSLTASSFGQDWPSYGGNNARNGQSEVSGPLNADVLWHNTTDFSIIAWHPFLLDGRVFTVREAGFPTAGGAANDAIVAYDLASGAELWRTTLPFAGNPTTEWIAWIGGARDGRVYVSRSSNGQPQPLRALDATTGATLWISALTTQAWAHDGMVFAPNGDVIVGDLNSISRLDHTNGATLWSTPRLCPVSGNCGAAATDVAVYVDEPVPGGNAISRLDLVTGARLYTGPTMPGVTDQNSPFVSPDGATVYMSRTQNNATVDFLYAFHDDGTMLTELWHRPVRWTTSHEHGLGRDGSIYTFLANNEFVRLDAANGNVLSSAGILAPIGTSNLSPKTAVDGHGNVYVSNGWANSPASDGRLWAFTADLGTQLFVLTLDRQNAGGPALGADGTLVMADRQGVHAYRSPAWTDLGFALAGTHGAPMLSGQGSLAAGTNAGLFLDNAIENSIAALIIGATPLNAPFLGGTLVPFPSVVTTGLPTGPQGSLPIVVSAPAGIPSAVPLYMQYWIADAAAPLGFAASNAVRIISP